MGQESPPVQRGERGSAPARSGGTSRNEEALVADVVGESLDELAELADELGAEHAAGAVRTWTSALLGHSTRYEGLAASHARASDDPLAGRCTGAERALDRPVEHVTSTGELRAGVTGTDIGRPAMAVGWAGEPESAQRPRDLVFRGLTGRAECPP